MLKFYYVLDKRNGKSKMKRRGFAPTKWTDDPSKRQLFRTTGAAIRGMYSYNINPERGKLGAKIVLPDWVEIISLNLVEESTKRK